MTITAGQPAPDIALAETNDETTRLSLSDLKGRGVVLYFYPRDDTPSCTAEAKDFSCLAAAFDAARTHL